VTTSNSYLACFPVLRLLLHAFQCILPTKVTFLSDAYQAEI